MINHKKVSFYKSNILDEVIFLQKEIFNKFNEDIEQVFYDGNHSDAIENYLNNNSWDIITILDVDCIPLSKKPFYEIKKYVNDSTIYGNAQISNSTPYAASSFISFTKKLYETSFIKSFMGRFWPDDNDIYKEADVAEVFVKENLKRNNNLILSFPIKCRIQKWQYFGCQNYPKFFYGNGTYFENDTYHEFESRFVENQNNFISVAKDFLING